MRGAAIVHPRQCDCIGIRAVEVDQWACRPMWNVCQFGVIADADALVALQISSSVAGAGWSGLEQGVSWTVVL